MPLYTIVAIREVQYEFNLEADTEEEAIAEIERIERDEDIEVYAYDWYPLEITEINADEEQE